MYNLVPLIGQQHTVFGSVLFKTSRRVIWSELPLLNPLFFIGSSEIVELNW